MEFRYASSSSFRWHHARKLALRGRLRWRCPIFLFATRRRFAAKSTASEAKSAAASGLLRRRRRVREASKITTDEVDDAGSAGVHASGFTIIDRETARLRQLAAKDYPQPGAGTAALGG